MRGSIPARLANSENTMTMKEMAVYGLLVFALIFVVYVAFHPFV
jgi:hypothetical protein